MSLDQCDSQCGARKRRKGGSSKVRVNGCSTDRFQQRQVWQGRVSSWGSAWKEVVDLSMHALVGAQCACWRRRKCTEEDMGCSDQERGIIELEFVQCLANPHYLNCRHGRCPNSPSRMSLVWLMSLLPPSLLLPGLAQNKYFDDPAFVKYLDYLQYWRQPEYSKLIRCGNHEEGTHAIGDCQKTNDTSSDDLCSFLTHQVSPLPLLPGARSEQRLSESSRQQQGLGESSPCCTLVQRSMLASCWQ
jgi:hypothetical protein